MGLTMPNVSAWNTAKWLVRHAHRLGVPLQRHYFVDRWVRVGCETQCSAQHLLVAAVNSGCALNTSFLEMPCHAERNGDHGGRDRRAGCHLDPAAALSAKRAPGASMQARDW